MYQRAFKEAINVWNLNECISSFLIAFCMERIHSLEWVSSNSFVIWENVIIVHEVTLSLLNQIWTFLAVIGIFLDFYAAICGKPFIKYSKFKLFINQSSHMPKPDVLNIQMTVATSNNIQYVCIRASFPHLSFTSATPIGELKDLPQ